MIFYSHQNSFILSFILIEGYNYSSINAKKGGRNPSLFCIHNMSIRAVLVPVPLTATHGFSIDSAPGATMRSISNRNNGKVVVRIFYNTNTAVVG